MMGDREKTLWFIIIMISVCCILISGMELYPITKNWESAVERSQNTQIGADKDLENIINFLENRLQYRLDYEFNLEKQPMRLANVIYLTDAAGYKLSNRKTSQLQVTHIIGGKINYAGIEYRGKKYTVVEGDSILNGVVKKIDSFVKINNETSNNKSHQAYHFKTKALTNYGDAIKSRNLLLFNDDINIYKLNIDVTMEYFYRNGHSDELYYIQNGEGNLSTNFGDLNYKKGDYIIIPRGVIYKLTPKNKTTSFLIESNGCIETPERYRNKFGQLLEHSPYCERDIRLPILNNPISQEGNFKVKVRVIEGIQTYTYAHNPFDLVGWDGCFYPWILNINDFEPITGSIHQPPPVHQTFQGDGFVVCSFVSRLFDYHPDAIPAPYPHSNIDSDELIYYSKGNFMSRKGIKTESITLHPMGLPHGPQPGKYEDSIGKKKTEELAVMVDTFKTLHPTSFMIKNEDKEYYKSWIK